MLEVHITRVFDFFQINQKYFKNFFKSRFKIEQ